MKNIYSLLFIGVVLFLFINAVIIKEKDPLNKRIFETKLLEIKEGQTNIKPKADELEFKDGKVFSNVLNEKLSYKWMKYTINKDSTFIDSKEKENQYFEVQVDYVDENDQTMVMICKIDNETITGEIKISKKEKLKKKFTFNGTEKLKKGKSSSE